MSKHVKDVKLSKQFQKVTAELRRRLTMRFSHNDIIFDIAYEGHKNCLKIFFHEHFEGF